MALNTSSNQRLKSHLKWGPTSGEKRKHSPIDPTRFAFRTSEDLGPALRGSVVGWEVLLAELVQTTTEQWITHLPTRCPFGHPLGAGCGGTALLSGCRTGLNNSGAE